MSRILLSVVVIALSAGVVALFFVQDDPSLAPLRSTLDTIRVNASTNLRPRGNPEMAVAKRQLREWIESKLPPREPGWDEKELERNINTALKNARLFCSENAPCARDQNSAGYLGDVEIHDEDLLRVKTRLGILCGSDESAYLYKWTGTQWRRVFESERNDYAEGQYDPQIIHAVIVSQEVTSQPSQDDYIVLTLGQNPSCASSWQQVYYRFWRVDESGSRLLFDGKDMAFIEAEPPLTGSVQRRDRNEQDGADTVLIEFPTASISTAVHNRQAVRQYAVRGDRVDRIDPIALSPRDFVDEWLTLSKTDSMNWSIDSSRQNLGNWHDTLRTKGEAGEFIHPTRHCTQPDLWQVGLEMNQRDPSGEVINSKAYYFTVRWRPPYAFTMMDVAELPAPTCRQEDPGADKRRSLFPNWRR